MHENKVFLCWSTAIFCKTPTKSIYRVWCVERMGSLIGFVFSLATQEHCGFCNPWCSMVKTENVLFLFHDISPNLTWAYIKRQGCQGTFPFIIIYRKLISVSYHGGDDDFCFTWPCTIALLTLIRSSDIITTWLILNTIKKKNKSNYQSNRKAKKQTKTFSQAHSWIPLWAECVLHKFLCWNPTPYAMV